MSKKKQFFMSIQAQSSEARLPSAYQEVEYIESDGACYIDTGLEASGEMRMVASIQYTGSTSSSNNIFLSGARSSSQHFTFLQFNNSGCAIGWGDNYISTTTTSNYASYFATQRTIETELYNGEQNLYGDDTLILSGTITSTTDLDLNIFLFARNYLGTGISDYAFIGKLWYAKYYDNNGTLLRNFVPCYRKSDGEIGMYDLVNDVFYTNDGTGTFTKGSDVIYTPTSAVSFATDSVSVIKAEAERVSNFYETYGFIPFNTPYGIYNPEDNDTDNIRTIELSSGEYIEVAIIGMCHDDLVTAYSGGGTKAGLTLQMVDDLATTYKMNSSSTNSGGWDSAVLRTTLNDTYYSYLPSEWQDVIPYVNKLTSAGSSSSSITTSQDRLFITSVIEVLGSLYQNSSTQIAYAGEGTQYEFYAKAPLIEDVNGTTWTSVNGGSTGSCISNGVAFIDRFGNSHTQSSGRYINSRAFKGLGYQATTADNQWMRSPAYSDTSNFCIVAFGGNWGSIPASTTFQVPFAFCI